MSNKTRRGFLGALAGLPFVGALVKAQPEHIEAGGIAGKPQYMVLLIAKDGNRVQRNYPTPPGREVYEARADWPAADTSQLEGNEFPMAPMLRVERIAFQRTGRMAFVANGPFALSGLAEPRFMVTTTDSALFLGHTGVPIYEEV